MAIHRYDDIEHEREAQDEMARAHERDYALKRDLDEVAHRLATVLESSRVGARERAVFEPALDLAKGMAAHIVAVWD